MKWSDSHRTLYNHSCHSMPELADDSIQCCVTSPPYWGLRKYKGEQDLIWGGDKECSHEWLVTPPRRSRKASDIVNLESKEATNRGTLGQELTPTDTCSLCGAWRGAYGLEPSVDLYIQHTVEICREIKRVLRPDGVFFLNLGDSYAGSGGTGNQFGQIEKGIGIVKPSRPSANLKPKDLCLIPFRVAIAAQEDGWWVRSVIIWNKPNPMPESVTDRPTESHEYILMLTKAARYYWDMEAVREVYTEPLNRWGGNDVRNSSHKYIDSYENGGDNGGIGAIGETSILRAGAETRPNPNGRNLRSVWTFPTQPFPGSHFAVFPEKLPELCIKAATPEAGCCGKCGMPWERIVERLNKSTYQEIKEATGYDYHDSIQVTEDRGVAMSGNQKSVGNTLTPDGKVPWYNKPDNKTLGWQPACKCNADKVQSVVLDPFCGSGTVLEVAAKLGRKAVGYEISEEYCDLIIERNRQSVIF